MAALKSISLELGHGEVLGLIGENGAGKSTLLKILSGLFSPDAGDVEWLGRTVVFENPGDALAAGIATIHQELAFFGHLTVAENLFLGQRWPRYRWGGVHWAALYRQAGKKLNEFSLSIDPSKMFGELSSAQRQEIAIVNALSRQARLIILDEPTASLSEPEVNRLFAHLSTLKQSGAAMIYVSHRLDEILRLTDRVAVLRDGELVSSFPTKEATVARMVRDMVGRPLDQVFPHMRSSHAGPVLLQLDTVTRKDLFENISFQVRAGEIVGLAGLVGCGRSELARAIFGLDRIDHGTIHLMGELWNPKGAHESLRHRLAYVPEERKRQGFVLDHSVRDSISIGFSDLITRWGLVPPHEQGKRISDVLRTYGVRLNDESQPIQSLSGGNQQKALLGRWLARQPQVLILDEPTRGVDVGAKAEIHTLIDQLAGQGRAILLISSDLQEVLGMSDRVLVMHEGQISAELAGDQMNQENVIVAASGLDVAPTGAPSL